MGLIKIYSPKWYIESTIHGKVWHNQISPWIDPWLQYHHEYYFLLYLLNSSKNGLIKSTAQNGTLVNDPWESWA